MSEKIVFVADKLSQAGIDVLEQMEGIRVIVEPGLSVEEQIKRIDGVHGLIVRSATKLRGDLLAAAKDLKVVARAGIGTDNIDIPACTEAGVLVENTPFGNATSAAEHAIALMFSLARKIPQAHKSMAEGKWEKSKFGGIELEGKTFGVIGAGNIGAIACKKAQGIGMNVIAFDPFLSDERAKEMNIEKHALHDMLSKADVVSVHVPLLDATKGLLDDEAFQKMKAGALLVHAARGGVVVEKALLKALDSGHLAGAALDVFEEEPLAADSPLRNRGDLILTPHLGASTSDAQIRVGVQAAEQVAAFLLKGELKNALNKVS